MRKPIPFSKYSGCGNDFILIDFREGGPELDIFRLCDRRQGIGADGVIYLEDSFSADYRMRIFNADGSEAEMCGNGIRCLGKFLREKRKEQDSFSIEVMDKIYKIALMEDGQVALSMQPPEEIEWDLSLDPHTSVDFLDTGVPHSVLFIDDLENDEWMLKAPGIRRHPAFGSRGCNVNFAKIREGNVYLRTYERGVEAETPACGTGAAATAIAAMKRFELPSPVTVVPRSGIPIQMAIQWGDERITKLIQYGPAELIYQGIALNPAFLLNKSGIVV